MLQIVIATKVSALFKLYIVKLIINYVLFNIDEVFVCNVDNFRVIINKSGTGS